MSFEGFARYCKRLDSHTKLLRTTPAYFLKNETLCGDTSHTRAMLSGRSSYWQVRIFFLRPCFLMSGLVCQWKPFGIPVGNTFQKAYLEEWIRVGDDSLSNVGEQCLKTDPTASIPAMVHNSEYKDCTIKHKRLEETPSAPRSTGQYEQPLDDPSTPKSSLQAVGKPDALTWKLSGTQGTASLWERTVKSFSPIQQFLCNMATTKTTITTRAMRPSVRRTTASSQTQQQVEREHAQQLAAHNAQ